LGEKENEGIAYPDYHILNWKEMQDESKIQGEE